MKRLLGSMVLAVALLFPGLGDAAKKTGEQCNKEFDVCRCKTCPTDVTCGGKKSNVCKVEKVKGCVAARCKCYKEAGFDLKKIGTCKGVR